MKFKSAYHKEFLADSDYAPGIFEIFKVGAPYIVSSSTEVL